LPRKEKPPQTELARRLREIRHSLGFKERKQFADYLGISPSSLGGYEKGLREPTISALGIYKNIGISLDWIATGKGDMFTAAETSPLPASAANGDKTALQKAVTAVEAGLGGSYVPPGKKAELIELACAVLKDSKAESLRKLISLLAALPKP